MQFALVNDERTPPTPGLAGTCPACGGAMIARCGIQRVHHWAHRSRRVCDIWWETETLWHRNWKNRFPSACQEVTLRDRFGEKHIADVRIGHGLTIEFQHSHLSPDERAAREQFYGNMMWVVDGSRLKRDLPRFLGAFRSFRTLLIKGLYITPFPEEAFPSDWLNSRVPVFFDFENAAGPPEATIHARRLLWCLLPGRALGHAVLLPVSREDFVLWAHSTPHPIQPQAIVQNVALALAEQKRRAEADSLRATMMTRQHLGWWRQGSRRRTARF